MVVYADVLIVLNIVVTYFILLATKTLASASTRTCKVILAALVGGLSSLYIFLPQQHFITEILIKLLFSAVITIIAFGAVPIKRYIRSIFSFYAVSFLYAGFMLGFWYVLRPAGMVINNGVIYFSISPVILILSTVVCYGIIMLARHFYKRQDENAKHELVTVKKSGSEYLFDCIIDTGNTLSDPLGSDKIVILSYSSAREMFGESVVKNALSLEAPKNGIGKFRILPYKTAMGNALMPAIGVDCAIAGDVRADNVLIGILKEDIGDFDGIISPSFFD